MKYADRGAENMAICKSCGADVSGDSKYCSPCEDKLRERLKLMETELDAEETRKREEAEQRRAEEKLKRLEEEKKQAQAAAEGRARKKKTTPVRDRDDKDSAEEDAGSGKRGSKQSSGNRDEKKWEKVRDSKTAFADSEELTSESEDGDDESQPWKSDIVLARFFAGMIDIALVILPFFLLGRIYSILGWAWAVAYLLLKDSLFDGASPGKQVLRLRVIRSKSGELISIENSFVRNIPLALGPAVMGIGRILVSLDIPMIPDPFRTLGAALMLLGAVLAAAFWVIESYWLKTDVNHRRFGDKIARTTVTWAEDSAERVDDEA
jgi:uncharacterized RDD family membrane protein YckC